MTAATPIVTSAFLKIDFTSLNISNAVVTFINLTFLGYIFTGPEMKIISYPFFKTAWARALPFCPKIRYLYILQDQCILSLVLTKLEM